jgi:hypothetical protein
MVTVLAELANLKEEVSKNVRILMLTIKMLHTNGFIKFVWKCMFSSSFWYFYFIFNIQIEDRNQEKTNPVSKDIKLHPSPGY